MPIKSKSQFKLIASIRDEYSKKSNAPKEKQWAFDPDYDLDKANFDALPNDKQEKLKRYIPRFKEIVISQSIPQELRPEQSIEDEEDEDLIVVNNK